MTYKHLISIFLIAFVTIPLSQAQNTNLKCPPGTIFTVRRGCIKSCLDNTFKDCADVYATIWDPKYCALSQDGQWRSFTFECQACQTADIIGVDKGACD